MDAKEKAQIEKDVLKLIRWGWRYPAVGDLRISNPSFEYERWRGQPCRIVKRGDGFVDVQLTGNLDPGLILRVYATAVRGLGARLKSAAKRSDTATAEHSERA